MNEGSSTISDSASTINTASSYDCLKQFYEKVSDDPGRKNLTFLCKLHLFQEAAPYINNVNSKPETAHWTKAPGEAFKVCVNKKIKRHGNSKPKQILHYPNCINSVQ